MIISIIMRVYIMRILKILSKGSVLLMAFCDLKPVSVSDEKGTHTYIIGSVIAIYGIGGEPPTVYSWDMVKSVSVTRKDLKINLGNSSFCVTNKDFGSDENVLRAIAIIECHQREYGFAYQHEKRMLPLKSIYNECTPGREIYIGEGLFDEGETAASFIALLNYKLMKILWLIAIVIAISVIVILQLTVGISRENVLYFIPIALASGAIVSLLVYIFTHVFTRMRFRRMCDADIASRQPITFVISRAGFAACESCVYESRDLISWGEVDYFIESDKMFILYKNNSVIAYIPKKAFEKKLVNGVADILSVSVEQR